MKVSLKQILCEEIQRRGFITQDEMERICKSEGYKISNGERRMRESRNLIEPVRNKKQANDGKHSTALLGNPKQKAKSSIKSL